MGEPRNTARVHHQRENRPRERGFPRLVTCWYGENFVTANIHSQQPLIYKICLRISDIMDLSYLHGRSPEAPTLRGFPEGAGRPSSEGPAWFATFRLLLPQVGGPCESKRLSHPDFAIQEASTNVWQFVSSCFGRHLFLPSGKGSKQTCK